MTCWSRANAEPSRINGFLVNREALLLAHDSYIGKYDHIPTHAVVALNLSRITDTEGRRFANTLQSLKQLFGSKINKLFEDDEEQKDEEQRTQVRKE